MPRQINCDEHAKDKTVTMTLTRVSCCVLCGQPATKVVETNQTATQESKNFRVVEHEGYSNKVVTTAYFSSPEDAMNYYHSRVGMDRFAGVGGKWRHYWSPQQKKDGQWVLGIDLPEPSSELEAKRRDVQEANSAQVREEAYVEAMNDPSDDEAEY